MLICQFKSLLRRQVRRCYTASDRNDTPHFAHTWRSSWSGQRHLVLVSGNYAGPDGATGDSVLVGWFAIRFAGIPVCTGAHPGSRRIVLGSAPGFRGRASAGRKTLEGGAGPDVRGCLRYWAGALKRLAQNRMSSAALLRSTVARAYCERRTVLDSPRITEPEP